LLVNHTFLFLKDQRVGVHFGNEILPIEEKVTGIMIAKTPLIDSASGAWTTHTAGLK